MTAQKLFLCAFLMITCGLGTVPALSAGLGASYLAPYLNPQQQKGVPARDEGRDAALIEEESITDLLLGIEQMTEACFKHGAHYSGIPEDLDRMCAKIPMQAQKFRHIINAILDYARVYATATEEEVMAQADIILGSIDELNEDYFFPRKYYGAGNFEKVNGVYIFEFAGARIAEQDIRDFEPDLRETFYVRSGRPVKCYTFKFINGETKVSLGSHFVQALGIMFIYPDDISVEAQRWTNLTFMLVPQFESELGAIMSAHKEKFLPDSIKTSQDAAKLLAVRLLIHETAHAYDGGLNMFGDAVFGQLEAFEFRAMLSELAYCPPDMINWILYRIISNITLEDDTDNEYRQGAVRILNLLANAFGMGVEINLPVRNQTKTSDLILELAKRLVLEVTPEMIRDAARRALEQQYELYSLHAAA